eukprot:scaffold16003_cov149-Amphora_coffeaeformis.AAC.3
MMCHGQLTKIHAGVLFNGNRERGTNETSVEKMSQGLEFLVKDVSDKGESDGGVVMFKGALFDNDMLDPTSCIPSVGQRPRKRYLSVAWKLVLLSIRILLVGTDRGHSYNTRMVWYPSVGYDRGHSWFMYMSTHVPHILTFVSHASTSHLVERPAQCEWEIKRPKQELPCHVLDAKRASETPSS